MSLIDEARTVRERIVARLRELEPLVREYGELRKLAAEMGIEQGGMVDVEGGMVEVASQPVPDRSTSPERGAAIARRPRQARQPRQASPKPARASTRPASRGARSAGRRRNSAGDDIGERVLEAIRTDPGKTVADYADQLGVPPTSLYRPVRELTNAGTIVKRARQLYLPEGH